MLARTKTAIHLYGRFSRLAFLVFLRERCCHSCRVFLFLLSLLVCSGGLKASPQVDQFLDLFAPGDLIDGATTIGERNEVLPIYPLLKGSKTVGYLFLNSDLTGTRGYSGKPIHILVALDTQSVIQAVHLVKHSEPIVLIGIPDKEIKAVLSAYDQLNILDIIKRDAAQPEVDIVSGATVTIMVMDDSILNAAKKVTRQVLLHEGPVQAHKPSLKAVKDVQVDNTWGALLDTGSMANLRLTVDQVNQAFLAADEPIAAEKIEDGEPAEPFIDLYLAPVSVPSIGGSLLGPNEYRLLSERLEEGQQAILVMANGRYSFRGSGFVRGGIFDRFLVRQGDDTIRFRDLDYKRLNRSAVEGSPRLDEVALYVVPKENNLDVSSPWQLELLVGRSTGSVSKAFTTFELPYQLPSLFLDAPPVRSEVLLAEESGAPLWKKLWHQKQVSIVVLVVALMLLTLAFFFQTWLAARPRLTDRFRVCFLLFTLFGVGWYANAQLSVVNILTVFHALVSGFDWAYFLMEPLIFIIWGSVFFALILWGRGAYCGWMCPFGALQELLNRLAKWFKVPQVKVPWGLHERLWALKYIIFLVLVGVALHSIELAEKMAEVEPFKTAIILKFDRTWPFVLFAIGVLIPGLFIERFYCRYFCPLGAALAIPSRMRVFDWLKRYQECGPQCQRCAKECMVQSIHPEGNINPNECMYCMHCQVLYLDQDRCYKHITYRKKMEQKKQRGAKKVEVKTVEVIASDAN